MEKFIYVFAILFCAVIIPLVLYLVIKQAARHKELLNGIVNYDTFMRKFVFSIELTEEELFAQLKMHNVNDVLDYCLSDDYTTITFIKYNGKYQYKLFVEEADDTCILRLEQIPVTSRAAMLINEFFIKKLNAKPLKFEEYSF